MARRIVGTLAGVVFLRVLGVSLLFAGFATHGAALGGSTFASGLAFAAYPAALAVFILPLAWLSDHVGRRPVMLGALALSAGGGIVAALAQDVVMLGIGRFVQGMGAVNGVALALAGEVGEPSRRTSRMAILGAAAGIGFAAGIVLGALLTPLVGVPGLLVGHSIATIAILLPVARVVPPGPPLVSGPHRPLDARVFALGAGAFAVNLAMTGLLFLSPLLIEGVPYAVAILVMVIPGGLGMFLSSRLADRGHARAVGLGAALLLGLAPLGFVADVPVAALLAAGVVFFIGHSALTALLPSLTATSAAEGRRGFAQGVQSTLQYLGSAVGAAVAAAFYPDAVALAGLFLATGVVAALGVGLATRAGLVANTPIRQ